MERQGQRVQGKERVGAGAPQLVGNLRLLGTQLGKSRGSSADSPLHEQVRGRGQTGVARDPHITP